MAKENTEATAKPEESKTPSPETPKESPKAQSKQQEELTRAFIPDTRGRFDRLKDWAKEKVVSIYEKVGTSYEGSWLGTVTTEKGGGLFNRVEAAFNDQLMKWHEGKAINIAQKLDGAKNQLNGFQMRRKSLEDSLAGLEGMRQQGISTIATEASIKRQMREFDEKMAKAQMNVNEYQSKLESRNNKMAGYVNERDRVCENLANRYEEKLKPWERQIESTKKNSENLSVEIERVGLKRDQIKKQIDDFSQKYQRFMSRGQLRDAVSGLTMQLKDCNDQIDRIAKEKSVIDGRIARAEDRANVYRNKKDKINSYTKGRPIKPEAGEKVHTTSYGEKEEIKTEGKENAETISEEEGSPQENLATQDWLKKWNEYLKDNNVPEGDLINESVWQNWIGRTDAPADFNAFKKSLEQYYDIKALNMPKKNFSDNIDNFAEKRREEEIENKK